MSEIVLFDFHGHRVRVVMIDGEPWWVFIDVCAALEISSPWSVVQRLEPEDLCSAEVLDPRGVRQSTRVINESGLYDLIWESRKPAAKEFKQWVKREVLPQIRQTGSYIPALDPDLAAVHELTMGLQRTREDMRALEKKQGEIGEKLSTVAGDVAGLKAMADDVADLKAVSPLSDTVQKFNCRDAGRAVTGTDMGRVKFKRWLVDAGVLFIDNSGEKRLYQDPWVTKGWAIEQYDPWENGNPGGAWTPYFTVDGIVRLRQLWDEAW